MNGRRLRTGIFFSILLLGTLSLRAQQKTEMYSFEFSGETLSDVLETVANTTGMDIVYDPTLVENHYIYKRIKKQSPTNLLKSILKGTTLDFITLSSGTFVIIQTLQNAPAYGGYYGKVVDSQTNEPLAGASVMFANASGGTNAGPSGSFALPRLVSGPYKIIFSYVGYQPVTKTIDIKADKKLRDKITLKQKPLSITPIVVSGYAPQIPIAADHPESIHPKGVWQAAGEVQDPIRSLSLFSGVQYGIPLTDLHLQGGQQGEHRILLDGVPVYNPYSFGHLFSAFSPYAIGKVTLYKAGYEVPEGSEIAGLINLTNDVDAVDNNRFLFEVNPLNINLRSDVYFPDIGPDHNASLKIMTAVRSNYWNIYKNPTLKHTLQRWDHLDPLVTGLLIDSDADPALYSPLKHQSDVRFHDVHLASKYKIDSYNTLSSSFYMGGNFVDTNLLRQAPPREDLPRYFYGHDTYRWNNFMGQLTYDRQVSPRFDLNSQISFTSNRLHQNYLLGTRNNTVIPGANIDAASAFGYFQSAGVQDEIPAQHTINSIRQFRIRSDGDYHFSPHLNFETGLEIDNVRSKVDLSDLFYLPTLSRQQSTFFSGYLNTHLLTGTYWKLTLGNRLTYFNPSKTVYSEPRASIQYDHSAGKGFENWSLRLSGGLYRQFINQYEITNPGPTALVPSLTIWSHAGTAKKPKAWHISTTFHVEPTQTTALNLEAFYKWQPTSYTISYGNLLEGAAINRSSFHAFAETTQIKSFGAGIRLHQSVAHSALQFILGYDYSFNRINKEAQFGRALPPPWNQPHRFQLRTLWHVTPTLTAIATWQSILGRSWGFRQAYYNFLRYKDNANFGSFSFDTPEDDHLSPFNQLDLSFIYRPHLSFTKLEARLNLINILNRRNTIDWTIRKQNNSLDEPYIKIKRTLPGFNPSFSIRVDF